MGCMTTTAVAEHPTTTDTRTHYVYRLYDAADRLLYVGMTNDPGQRLREHKRSKPWWNEVYRHDLQEAVTRADAFFVEAAAILQEKPAYNRDIPSLERYDLLKSRSTLADPLTAEDRVASLEHQLREARREIHRLAAEDRELEKLRAKVERVEGDNAELQAEASRLRQSHADLLDVVGYWKEEATAKEQTRIFVVEGPRVEAVTGAPACTPAVTAPKRSLLSRLLG
jgi:predicted GIY-YIG superfamily endonuclease